MTKYSILHIPTGNFIHIEIYVDAKTIPFKLLKQIDIKKYTVNYFLSHEHAIKYNEHRTDHINFQLITEDMELLENILKNDHVELNNTIYKHVYMDLYEKTNPSTYNHQILKSEFEIVEVKYEEDTHAL
jgi:hypothetical protein